MFGKYKIALANSRRFSLAPLEKGGTGLLVPLLKGDLGGSPYFQTSSKTRYWVNRIEVGAIA
jgi:hypothetical protein